MTEREKTLTVTTLSPSGEGLAEHNGRWIKLQDALPGERVRVLGEGRSLRVVAREGDSTDRVRPQCPIVNACGGCAWQHASQSIQQRTRLEHLVRALPAELRGAPIESTVSPLAYGYRTRARMAWRVERGRTTLGFHARGTSSVVDVPSCAVLDPRIDGGLRVLRDSLSVLGRSGEVSLALGVGGAPVVSLRPEEDLQGAAFSLPETLVAQGFAGVALWPLGASIPVTAGDPNPVVSGADGTDLVLAAEGFAQAHQSLNRTMVEHVTEAAACEGRAVIELYAGAGNFTVSLSPKARKVVAVESDRGATAALAINLKARQITNVVVRTADAESLLPELKGEVVVLDPPREGARAVCEMLASRKMRRIVYVSCDPATLGRDLGILRAGYEVTGLRAFEMFPQTPHLETVATLVRRREAP